MFVSTVTCFLLANIILIKTDFVTINLNETSQCDPNTVYKDDNGTCICTTNGTWANQECLSIFHSEIKNDVCVPNKYVFVDCNVCFCGPDGKINMNRCSKHDCVNLNKTRRSDAIVGTCDPKTFYTLEPCQFCYCVNKHKLVCNNKPKTIRINLGQYELNQCGDNLIKELSDLLPKKHQRTKQKSGKTQTRPAKEFKMMTTAILLEDDDNSPEDLIESTDIYSHTNVKKYSNDRNMMVNEDQQTLKDDIKTSKEFTSDASNDLSVETFKNNKSFKKRSKKHSDVINENNQNHNITIDIPSVLEKVLSLVLRKSMVSLESGHNCLPGSTIKSKCNTCFCLSNGKMLCTKDTCK